MVRSFDNRWPSLVVQRDIREAAFRTRRAGAITDFSIHLLCGLPCTTRCLEWLCMDGKLGKCEVVKSQVSFSLFYCKWTYFTLKFNRSMTPMKLREVLRIHERHNRLTSWIHAWYRYGSIDEPIVDLLMDSSWIHVRYHHGSIAMNVTRVPRIYPRN